MEPKPGFMPYQLIRLDLRGGGAVYPITFDADGQMTAEIEGRARVIYEVRDGRITIKGQQYPVKLADGFYIIRKLTVLECPWKCCPCMTV